MSFFGFRFAIFGFRVRITKRMFEGRGGIFVSGEKRGGGCGIMRCDEKPGTGTGPRNEGGFLPEGARGKWRRNVA